MSIQTKKYTYTVPANSGVKVMVTGRFFRILACSGPLTVQGASVKLESLIVGDGFEKTPFDWLTLTDETGAANLVTFVVSDEAFLNAPQSNTAITANKAPQSAAFANSTPALGVASAQLAPANAARQYLMVQNKDLSATIWIRFGAGAATPANGFRLGPGDAWEFPVAPLGALQAISDVAAPSVVVVEG